MLLGHLVPQPLPAGDKPPLSPFLAAPVVVPPSMQLTGPGPLVSDRTTPHSHTDSAHLERPRDDRLWDGLVWLLQDGSFAACFLRDQTWPQT